MAVETSRRSRIVELAILLASVAVSLLLADALVGVLDPADAVIGPTRPGRHVFVNREFVQHQFNDEQGYRHSGFEPGADARNALLLGDSFAEGMGLSDEETIAWRVNDRRDDSRLQLFNAGKSGANLDDYARIHDAAIQGLPHSFEAVVVLVYLGNDVIDYGRLASSGAREKRARRLLPNIRRRIRRYRDQRERSLWFQTVDASPYAEWFERNLGYFGRSQPLSAAERAWMEERFRRIPEDLRASMREGLVNPWNFQWMVTPQMQDLVYNVDSEANRRAVESSAERLRAFIERSGRPVYLVLVPAKFQVSEERRRLARSVLEDAVEEDEFSDLLAVNHRLLDALAPSLPRDRVLDLTHDVLAQGWEAYYYPIDDHFHAGGAERAAERILRLLEGRAPGAGARRGRAPGPGSGV